MSTTPAPETAAAPKARAPKVPGGKAGKSTPTQTPTANGKPARPAAKAETAAKPVDGRVAIRAASMLLKQVSDATRLEVLLMLESGPLHVGAICERLGNQSQPAVSHHLALCRHGRLISPHRSGKNNFYELTDEGRRLVECVRGLVGTEG